MFGHRWPAIANTILMSRDCPKQDGIANRVLAHFVPLSHALVRESKLVLAPWYSQYLPEIFSRFLVSQPSQSSGTLRIDRLE
jgi:hypothetical protein